VNKIITSLVNFKSHVFTIDLIKEKVPKEGLPHEQERDAVTFSQVLQLKNISFSYNDKPLLKDIYLTINKGDIITIVGKSGAGKSTLLHIITQLLKPQQGYVSIDGHKINTDDTSRLPGIFAYIPQDPFILEGSILDNITLGKNDYDTNVLKDLLADFYMESVIDNLPQNWDTFIGNNGHQLSGGQKQRIALVRALLQQPRILILDEATNQLESELEIKVLNRLKEMVKSKNITLLLVSHHVENIKAISDHIYKLSTNGLEKLTEK
jgi:ATP-binding cassette, subfamily B, bacterial PglK